MKGGGNRERGREKKRGRETAKEGEKEGDTRTRAHHVTWISHVGEFHG
jgi:hypothetical protein